MSSTRWSFLAFSGALSDFPFDPAEGKGEKKKKKTRWISIVKGLWCQKRTSITNWKNNLQLPLLVVVLLQQLPCTDSRNEILLKLIEIYSALIWRHNPLPTYKLRKTSKRQDTALRNASAMKKTLGLLIRTLLRIRIKQNWSYSSRYLCATLPCGLKMGYAIISTEST